MSFGLGPVVYACMHVITLYSVCWGFAISILIGSAGTELKAKNISKRSPSYQKQFLTCVY